MVCEVEGYYTIDSVIKGHHVYTDGASYIGEVLKCHCDVYTQPSRSFGLLGQAAKQKCPLF